jgi:hypothetical protein
MIGEKVINVDRHVIINVFKISNIGWKEKKQANKQIAEAMLQGIALPNAYINAE